MPCALSQAAAGPAQAVNAPMQSHCTTWLGYRIAASQWAERPEEVRDAHQRPTRPLGASRPHRYQLLITSTFGFMLDELSAQGLRLWQDQGQRWCWAWAETALHSERGF